MRIVCRKNTDPFYTKYHIIKFFAVLVLFCMMGCRTVDKRCFVWSTSYKDSIMISHWDSVLVNGFDKIQKASVCRLHALAVHDSLQKTIMGYSVYGDEVKIDYCKLNLLRFMLCNENFYSDEKTTWKTLFSPYLAISIGDKSEKMYLLISYNTPEWALVKNGEVIRRNIYKRGDMLIQYALEIFPDDEYLISIFELNR